MPSPPLDPERLFLANLPLIERLAGSSARHLRMPSADAEDFVSHVKIRLIENDYAKLRQYRGESSIKGFLSTTISHLGLDYADHLWGKWRTPAGVKRLGPLAVHLHRLLTRDRLSVDAAYETLWTNYKVTESRAELDALVAQLPARTDRQFEGDDVLAVAPSPEKRPDDIAAANESRATTSRAETELKRAMAALAPQDRLVLVLHYRDGLKVSVIARKLSLRQSRLYDHIKAIEVQLGDAMRAAGLDAATVIPLLENWSPNLGWDSEVPDQTVTLGPSLHSGAQT